ncbi:lytic transglycosylase, partial [Escherichia coli]
MHKIIAIILIMFAGNTYSSDCFELAGRDYKIDPDLLRAISWHESRNRVNAIGINP